MSGRRYAVWAPRPEASYGYKGYQRQRAVSITFVSCVAHLTMFMISLPMILPMRPMLIFC